MRACLAMFIRIVVVKCAVLNGKSGSVDAGELDGRRVRGEGAAGGVEAGVLAVGGFSG